MLDICQECWNAINGWDEDYFGVLDTLEGVIVPVNATDAWDIFYCDTCHKEQFSPVYHGEYLEKEIR